MYLGLWQLDDNLTFYLDTMTYATGAATDATGSPAYRIYKDEVSTPVLTGSLALLDGDNTTGFYSEQITLSAANGFEYGKQYAIYMEWTVAMVQRSMHHTFQIEVASVAVSAGASLNTTAASATLTTGTQSSGTYASTALSDDSRHTITDSAGTLEIYYQFSVGGDGIANTASWEGYLNGSNDTVLVYARNWAGASWEQIGTIAGKNTTTDEQQSWALTTAHTGTGANSGLVRIRFQNTGLTSASLNTDRLLVGYAIVNGSVGYSDGAVWLDTEDGVAGTEAFVNGTADNATNTLANALVLMSALNLHRIHLVSGSSITLTGAFPYHILGDNYTLALGGQDIAEAIFEKFGPLSGIATSSGAPPVFNGGPIFNATLPPCVILNAGFAGTLTIGSAGDYLIIDCHSQVAGGSTPIIDMAAGVGATNISIRKWSGGLRFDNMQAGDVVSVDAISGGTITVNGTGGTIHIRGMVAVSDGSAGAVTVVQTQALNRPALNAALAMSVGR